MVAEPVRGVLAGVQRGEGGRVLMGAIYYILYIIRVKIITNCHLVHISEPRSAARPRLAGGLARRGRGVAAHQLLYVGLTTRVLKIFDDDRKIF